MKGREGGKRSTQVKLIYCRHKNTPCDLTKPVRALRDNIIVVGLACR